MVPRQRRPGQTGGYGGQFSNRGASVSRGGSPSRGGAGGGKTPNKGGGCKFAPELWVMLLVPLTILTSLGGLVILAVRT